jgi:hypothetical protein
MNHEHTVFYLHEDDWGMVDIVPIENLSFLHEERERMEAFAAEHFDGVGWTDIYVRSEEPFALSSRAMPYARLAELFGRLLPAAARVETGYSSYREPCASCFAFGKAYDFALYGDAKGDIVTALSLSMVAPSIDAARKQELVAALGMLGREFRLALVDWQRSQIVDLAQQAAIEQYLGDEDVADE